MVFYSILAIVLSIFGLIGSVVFPALPRSFFVYWDSGLSYIRQGIRFIGQFIPMTYANNLLAWWISLGAILLSVELIYAVWQLITGNGHVGRAADHLLNTPHDAMETLSAEPVTESNYGVRHRYRHRRR